MSNKIYSCLWFNGQAKAAAQFYTTVFKNCKLISENDFVSMLDIEGSKLMCLNGGPQYKHTPAVSQFVTCESDEEIQHLWDKLSEGGKVLMNLGKYDWSPNYGWCEDKFGVSWQIYKGDYQQVNQKVVPCFLFVDKAFGRAEEAMNYYFSVFKHHHSQGILKYGEEDTATAGKVLHAQFTLNDSVFMVMDRPGTHQYTFSPAASMVIECDTQQEIDHYWEKLGEQGVYNKCGWLDDRFGISWQVVPSILGKLMADPAKAPGVVQAFMKMTKFDIAALQAV